MLIIAGVNSFLNVSGSESPIARDSEASNLRSNGGSYYVRRKVRKVISVKTNSFWKKTSCDRFQRRFLHRTSSFLYDL
jgi:hypothetical protein